MAIREILHKLFRTDIRKQHIWEITVSELRDMGVEAVAIDADNTTSFDGTTDPLPFTEDWIQEIKDAGIKVILVSNASISRAQILADKYDIPVVGFACKPLPFGYLRASLRLRLARGKICMIGDQLFTDILGANAVGFKSIYVYPHQPETRNVNSFRARRMAEKIIFNYQDNRVAKIGTNYSNK